MAGIEIICIDFLVVVHGFISLRQMEYEHQDFVVLFFIILSFILSF